MNWFINLSLFLFLIFTASIQIGCTQKEEFGTAKNPIKLSLVPGQEAGILSDNGNSLAQFLNHFLMLKFQI